MMKKKTIRDLDLKDKRVLMRVDFNVPIHKESGEITNTQRMEAALPTIQHALDQGASVVLMSHLGRPDGHPNPAFSLKPVALKLEELLGRKVKFLDSCVGASVEAACQSLEPGSVVLMENLRFYIEEEGKGLDANGEKIKADPEKVAEFRQCLTRLGDVYVNDAFGTAHRAHSSVVGIDLPDRVAGFLMEKELNAFAKVLDNPERPFLAILGGAKVADKIPLIENLIDLADDIIIGGGMAYTFKKVLDAMPIGDSLYDEAGANLIPQIVKKAGEKGVNLHLPTDYICADRFDPEAETRTSDDSTGIPDGWMGLDCGEKSRERFEQIIAKSKTIIWNGPAGVFEFDRFSHGTHEMAQAVANATALGATSVVGGGDTATAAKKFGVADKVTHCSTGGGASLELLEGKDLPGVAILNNA